MGKYIKNLYNRDKAVFTALNKCGNLSEEHFNKLDISPTRLKNYCREGYIKKTCFDIKGSRENGIAYRLTPLGKEVGTKKFGLCNYVQEIGHERHNLDVANKYLSLTEKERETVLNEREIKELVENQIKEIDQQEERDRYQEMLDQGAMSMPDIIYTTEEGVIVAFETITDNYGNIEIQAKEETCDFLNIQIEINKI